jgi:hypothetical protein
MIDRAFLAPVLPAILGLIVMLRAALPAQASCMAPFLSFNIDTDPSVRVEQETTSVCRHAFVSNEFTVYERLQILSKPRNGMLIRTDALSLLYEPTKGFKGKDEYVIRVCGKRVRKAGCAKITYDTTVR